MCQSTLRRHLLVGSSIALPSRPPSRTLTHGDLDLQPPPERPVRSSCSTYGGCGSMLVSLSCGRNTLPDAPASLTGWWGFMVQADGGTAAVSMNPLRTEQQLASFPPCPAPPPLFGRATGSTGLRCALIPFLCSLTPLFTQRCPPCPIFLHSWHRGPAVIWQQWTS